MKGMGEYKRLVGEMRRTAYFSDNEIQDKDFRMKLMASKLLEAADKFEKLLIYLDSMEDDGK